MKTKSILKVVYWLMRTLLVLYIIYMIGFLYAIIADKYVLNKQESVVFIIGTLLFLADGYITKSIVFLAKSKKRKGKP